MLAHRPVPEVPHGAVEVRGLAHHHGHVPLGGHLEVGHVLAVAQRVADVLVHACK